jgi:hypothetical protein
LLITQNIATIGGGYQIFGFEVKKEGNVTVQNNNATLYGVEYFTYPNYLKLTTSPNNPNNIITMNISSGHELPDMNFELRDY